MSKKFFPSLFHPVKTFFRNHSTFSKILKFLGREVSLALVILIATLVATKLHNQIKINQNNTRVLTSISLSMSMQYIDSLLGTPIISIDDSLAMTQEYGIPNSKTDETVTHRYHYIDGCLVRVTYHKEKVIAFFYILLNEKRTINIAPYSNRDAFVLGKDKYENLSYGTAYDGLRSPTAIKTGFNNATKYHYYSEFYEHGRSVNYGTTVFGTVSISEKPYMKYDEKKTENMSEEDMRKTYDKLYSKYKYNFQLTLDSYYNIPESYLKGNDKVVQNSGERDFSVIKNTIQTLDNLYPSALPNLYGLIDERFSEEFDVLSPIREWDEIYSIFSAKY